jgi:hypothetical protein
MGCESDCLPEEQDIELRYLRTATVVSAGFHQALALQSPLAQAGENDEFAGDYLGLALWLAVTNHIAEGSQGGLMNPAQFNFQNRSRKVPNWDSE